LAVIIDGERSWVVEEGTRLDEAEVGVTVDNDNFSPVRNPVRPEWISDFCWGFSPS
jgi:hypothetical protein